jgi:hypothetical protein
VTCSIGINTYYSYSGFACLITNDNLCRKWTTNHYEAQGYLICLNCQAEYIYNDQCFRKCTQVNNNNLVPDDVNKVCRCRNGSISISSLCHTIQACPLKMYLNQTLGACMSCDFGCATCESNGNIIVCTSCYPGYVFFPTPRPSCRLDSCLIDCTGDLQLEQGRVCVPIAISLDYQLCVSTVPNCRICVIKTTDKCLVCQTGWVLFMNNCLR